MDEQTLRDRVMAIVTGVLHKRLPVARLPDGITFHDLCLGGFERANIAGEIERQWPVDLTDTEISGWQSLDDIVHSLRTRV